VNNLFGSVDDRVRVTCSLGFSPVMFRATVKVVRSALRPIGCDGPPESRALRLSSLVLLDVLTFRKVVLAVRETTEVAVTPLMTTVWSAEETGKLCSL